jgi:serine/threonine protein kinase
MINNSVDFPTDCDPALKDFISICLQKEPSKRATLEQLMDHNWPTNNG